MPQEIEIVLQVIHHVRMPPEINRVNVQHVGPLKQKKSNRHSFWGKVIDLRILLSNLEAQDVHSGKLTNGLFSIAMLVYQRVPFKSIQYQWASRRGLDHLGGGSFQLKSSPNSRKICAKMYTGQF